MQKNAHLEIRVEEVFQSLTDQFLSEESNVLIFTFSTQMIIIDVLHN